MWCEPNQRRTQGFVMSYLADGSNQPCRVAQHLQRPNQRRSSEHLTDTSSHGQLSHAKHAPTTQHHARTASAM